MTLDILKKKTKSTHVGAGFVKDGHNDNSNNGNTVSEELSEADLEDMSHRDKENIVVSELSEGGKIREAHPDEELAKIELGRMDNRERLETFFTQEELEGLEESEKRIEGKESDDKDLYEALKEECERRNKELKRQRKEEEIEKLMDFAKPERYRADVQNLSGEQFSQLIQEANDGGPNREEELQEQIQAIEEKYDTSSPEVEGTELSEEVEEMAVTSLQEKGGVWEEFAADLAQSDEETTYEAIADGAKKITTVSEEMKRALRSPKNFDGDVQILEDTGEKVVGIVSR